MSCIYTFISIFLVSLILIVSFTTLQVLATGTIGVTTLNASPSLHQTQQLNLFESRATNCLSQLAKTELARISLKRLTYLKKPPHLSLSHPLSQSTFNKFYLSHGKYLEISEKLNEMVREKCSNSPIIEEQLKMIDYLVSKIKRVHSKFRIFPNKKSNKFSNYSIFYNYLLRYPKIDEQLFVGKPPNPLIESVNSPSFPVSCKYLIFDRLVFKDALHFFSPIIFDSNVSSKSSLEEEYLKVFNHEINSVDVSKNCIDSGGRIGKVDVYNEISKYFPQRNVIGQLMALNRINLPEFKQDISNLANFWFGSQQTAQFPIKEYEIPKSEYDRYGSLNNSRIVNGKVEEVTPNLETIRQAPIISPQVTVTHHDEGINPLKSASAQPISMKLSSKNFQDWFTGISIIRQAKTLLNFLYRDVYLSTVYKTREFVIWLVNGIDFSQTQLEETNPFMLDNPYVSYISHAIVSVAFTLLIMMCLPYANSISFIIFLVSALSFESLSLYYMFLDNSDRMHVEQNHIVRGEKMWLFYQLLNFLYIPMISMVFCKNRNAAFIPTASCFILSNLYMYNSIAMFEFFNQLAFVSMALALLRSINFGEFIVRDVVETVQQDLEIDKNSIVSNREAFELVKQYNESREAPTKIFIDERAADTQQGKPASTYDMFIHEFSHIPVKPVVSTIVDALLGPVDDLDVSEMTKEMPGSPCPTYSEDIRE